MPWFRCVVGGGKPITLRDIDLTVGFRYKRGAGTFLISVFNLYDVAPSFVVKTNGLKSMTLSNIRLYRNFTGNGYTESNRLYITGKKEEDDDYTDIDTIYGVNINIDNKSYDITGYDYIKIKHYDGVYTQKNDDDTTVYLSYATIGSVILQ